MDKSKRVVAIAVGLVPLVCCLGGLLLVFSATRSARKAEASELAAARRLGMPLEPSDLRMAPVVPDKNAAVVYRQVANMLEHGYSKAQREVAAALSKNATPKELSEAGPAVVQLRPVFDLVTSLDRRPVCDFERDWSKGPSLLFPEYADMKGLVKDLCIKSDELDSRGDTAASLKCMSYAHRVAADAGSDPCLISMLVEIACHAIVDREYEVLIDRHSNDAAYLSKVRGMIVEHARLPDPRKYLGGEVVLNRIAIRMLAGMRDLAADNQDSDSSTSQNGVQKSIFQSRLVQSTLDSKLLGIWITGWSQFPQDSQDWAAYLGAMKTMEAHVEQDHSLGNMVDQILFPVFSEGMDSIGNSQAHDRMLLTSIALLNARDRNGAPPVALPSGLGDISLDPFDGNSLRYRRQGRGFLVYSIGRDRVDNGGHVRKSSDPPGAGYDEVMSFH